jgi:hypothetical protein
MPDTTDPQQDDSDGLAGEDPSLQGQLAPMASEQEIRKAVEKAFDYRGDVTVTLKDGRTIVGYVFDRRVGASLGQSQLRIMPAEGGGKVALPYSDLAGLAFTGKDTAAGKSFETWVRKYEKRQGNSPA